MKLEEEIKLGEIVVFEKVKSRFHPEYCAHLHVEYSDEHSTITCRDCKEKLDPMKWVLAYMELMRKYKEKVDLKLIQAELIEERIQRKAKYCCEKCGEFNNVDLTKLTKLISDRAILTRRKLLKD